MEKNRAKATTRLVEFVTTARQGGAGTLIALDHADLFFWPAEFCSARGESRLDAMTLGMILDLLATALSDVNNRQPSQVVRAYFFRDDDLSPRWMVALAKTPGRPLAPRAVIAIFGQIADLLLAMLPSAPDRLEGAGDVIDIRFSWDTSVQEQLLRVAWNVSSSRRESQVVLVE